MKFNKVASENDIKMVLEAYKTNQLQLYLDENGKKKSKVIRMN